MRNEAEYMKEYRKRNPEVLKRQKRREKARSTALRMLAEKYPEDYKKILAAVERQMIMKEGSGERERGSQDRVRQRGGQGDGTGPAVGSP